MDPRPDIQRAQAAISRGCWAEAFEALSLADRGDGLGADGLQLLGTAAYLTGQPDETVAALRRAAEAFAASGDARRAARAMFWLSFALINEGGVAQGGGWLARAGHVLATAPDDCPERGLLLAAAAFRCNQAGDYAEAQRQAAHAAQIGRRSGDPDVLGLALTQQGAALLMTADVAGAMRLLDEAMVAVVSAEVSPIAAGTVYCAVIAFCHLATDLDRAREWTEALDAWCGKQPEMLAFTGQCRVHRAQLLRRHGRWQEAVEEAELACERTARPEEVAAAGAARYEQAEVCRLRGDLATAESAYRQAGRYGHPPDPGLALLRLAQGDTAAAYEAVRRAAAETAGTPRRVQLLPALAEVAVAAGDLAAARQAADELTAAAERAGVAALLAFADSAQATVALAEGHAARALPAGRSAIERWRGLRMPYETARAHITVGLACRAAGDEDGCALELDAARHLLAGLGAGPDLARISALDRPAATPGVLTERELQVLRLIAAGRTNHAIGSELGLAEKTVERHVSNVLTKLGVPSRAAATAYGYEHKLL
ncbi:MAG TPA: LuxR C-terminal-related transcriptional regulator [Streptosporangiaceae bacterium]|nr:LuxR C-terminal-related transcriptional regulator [Streptosporangiaceae bacterium]